MVCLEKTVVYVFHTGDNSEGKPSEFIENCWVDGTLLRITRKGGLNLAVMTGDLLSDAGLKIKYRSGEIQEFSVCSRTMKSALVSVDVEKKVCVVTKIHSGIDRLLICHCSLADAELLVSGNCECMGDFKLERAVAAFPICKGWSLVGMQKCLHKSAGNTGPSCHYFKWVAKGDAIDPCGYKVKELNMTWEAPAFKDRTFSNKCQTTFKEMAVSFSHWGQRECEDFVIPVTPLFPDEGRKKCCLQKSYGSGDYASAPWTKEDFIHPVFDPKEVLQNNAKKARNCTYAADALECIYSARGRKDLADDKSILKLTAHYSPFKASLATKHRSPDFKHVKYEAEFDNLVIQSALDKEPSRHVMKCVRFEDEMYRWQLEARMSDKPTLCEEDSWSIPEYTDDEELSSEESLASQHPGFFTRLVRSGVGKLQELGRFLSG